MHSFFKKPIFWICFSVVSALCFAYAFTFFPKAFPIVNITITMDKGQAIHQSNLLAETFAWGPEHSSHAVSFDTDTKTKYFIELEGGGQEVFSQMIKDEYYMPYKWHVRLFREFDANETHVYFTPDGTPYAFNEQLPEDLFLPRLKKRDAQELAQTAATKDWRIDLAPYQLIEIAKKVQPNGRTDRTFVYERTDVTLKEGTYRLKLRVSGNKLTKVKHLVKVPQAFMLRYQEIRSTNNLIARAASVFAFIMYLLLAAIIGLFILIRLNWVIWQAPVKWALIVAGLQMLTTLNELPLTWMHYHTQTPMQGFLLNVFVQAFYNFFITFSMISLIFIAAESLTRRAFGSHVQLWRSWSKGIANSYTILGQTIGGYLMIGIDMAILVTFYYITTTYLGWWSPMSQLVDPNVLAHYMPWLSPIAISLGAGFIEECKFRAIPLASAALLGQRFGGRRFWIAGTFVLQAIIFGAAHANYASLPAYSRLVELIVPSFLFAALYLRFGLLPAVIMHYAYDVFWFALPIFLMHTPQALLNQSIIILCTFIPLLILFYRYYQEKKWTTLQADAYNAAWLPKPLSEATQTKDDIIEYQHLNRTQHTIIVACLCASICIWWLFTPFTSDAPALTINRATAIATAQETLASKQQNLQPAGEPSFEAVAQIKPKYEPTNKEKLQHKYIWQTYGKDTYHHLLGSYLQPPHWRVRFVRFEGDTIERAQEYAVNVGATSFEKKPHFTSLTFEHKIPEQLPGEKLTKKEARLIVQQALQDADINLDDVDEVSANPKKHPKRIDWTFTYAYKKGKTALDEGQARIVVALAGNQLSKLYKKIHVPQLFERQEQKHQNSTNALQMLCYMLLQMLFIAGMVVALLRWAYKELPARLFFYCFVGYIALFSLKMLNGWPQFVAQFKTQEPLIHQILSLYGMLMLQFLLRSGIFAFASSLILSIIPTKRYRSKQTLLLIGVAAGVLLQSGNALLAFFQPSTEPLWAQYLSMGGWSVTISFALAYMIQFFVRTMVFSIGALALNYVTNYGKHHLIPSGIICTLASLCMTGITSVDSIWYWLASSIALGALLWTIWYYLIRYSYVSIPIMQATIISLLLLQQLAFNAIGHSLFIVTFTIGLILCIAGIWFNYYFKQTEKAHTKP